jgi:hypothetical protein
MASSILLSDNGVSSGSAGLKSSGGNDGVLLLQTTTSGGTSTTAVTVDTSQNVGIGTTSPNVPLHITKAGVDSSVGFYSISKILDASGNKGLQIGYDNATQTTTLVASTTSAQSSLAFWTYGASWAERARIDTSGNLVFAGNNLAATSYNANAGTSYTVTLPDGYGAFELSISAYSNNSGAYGVRATVFHCFAYSGYPRTVFSPNVSTVTTMVNNMVGTAPTISISTGVNGALTVTIAGSGTLGSGYTLRRLNNGPAF